MAKKAQEHEIEVDVSRMTIGDLELFEQVQGTGAMPPGMIALLDRVVVGGVRHRPLVEIGPIATAVGDAIGEMFKGTGGN